MRNTFAFLDQELQGRVLSNSTPNKEQTIFTNRKTTTPIELSDRLSNSSVKTTHMFEARNCVAHQVNSTRVPKSEHLPLSSHWRRIGEHPKVADLEPSTAGEVLLRAGVLTGAIGSKDQITDAQENAKDLISESLTIFQSLRYQKKIAEAQAELAWFIGAQVNLTRRAIFSKKHSHN